MPKDEIVRTHNGYGWTSTVPNQITVSLLNFLSRVARPSPLVLDIGAGFGVGTLPLLESGASVTALDLEESHLNSIRQEAESRSLAHRLTTIAGRFPGTLTFEHLDAIHCSNVLHFLPGSEIEIGATKMYEWLKPGGNVFLQVGTVYAGHIRRLLPVFEERRRSGVKWAGERPQGKSVTWVAEIDGKVIGWQSLQDSGVTQILRIAQSSTYIAEEWQANGVGRKLLYHAQVQASNLGFDTVLGFVKTDNTSSIKLVQTLGWSLIGNLPRVNNRDPEFAYYAYAVPKQVGDLSEKRGIPLDLSSESCKGESFVSFVAPRSKQ